MKLLVIALCLLFTLNSCVDTKDKTEISPTIIELGTEYGNILIQLYDDTPLHRDNFKRLVNEGFYDSLQFHRIINQFVIQAGDPGSSVYPLPDDIGSGGLDYTIPSEFVPHIFHKRGAVGAARDDNPARASSSTQFYIVQGRIQSDSTLTVAEHRINSWKSRYYVRNAPQNKELLDSIAYYREIDDSENLNKAINTLNQLVESFTDFDRYEIPNTHREVYKTIGGIPHLDQNYTVFAEVIDGMDIVDKIAMVETDKNDRPLDEMRILFIRIIQ